jgi:uncharacterized protein with PIN domain
MVIDTSALIAILSDEPEAPGLEAAIEADSVRLLSAASPVEASIVIESRYGEAGGRELDLVATDEPLLFKGDDFSKTDIHTVELASLGGR